MPDDLPEFFVGQLQTIDSLRAEVERLREALAEASEELDAAGCQVAASNAHRAAMRGMRDDCA